MPASWNIARAIREALVAELEADRSVVLLGKELATGGLFGAGDGIAERCIEIPHDESPPLGAALGMAIAGLRPVCELLAAEVQAAFEAARRAGPPPAGSLFDQVTVQRNPALQRQARWFLARETRDGR